MLPSEEWRESWPDRGVGFLPKPDLVVEFQVYNRGRKIVLSPHSEFGELMTERMTKAKQPHNGNLN